MYVKKIRIKIRHLFLKKVTFRFLQNLRRLNKVTKSANGINLKTKSNKRINKTAIKINAEIFPICNYKQHVLEQTDILKLDSNPEPLTL